MSSSTVGEKVISFTDKGIQNLIANNNVKTVKLNVILSDMAYDDIEAGQNLILKSDAFDTLISSGKNLTVFFTDQKGKERYSWTFQHDLLAASKNEIKDVDLKLSVSGLNYSALSKQVQTGDERTEVVVNFGYEGILPSQAGVKVYVGDLPGVILGSKAYLYHVNPKTGKLETLPYSSNYTVDKDGYISFDIVHCSDFVILFEKAANSEISALLDQISVIPSKKTLYTNSKSMSSASIGINLPATLEIVRSLKDNTTQPAIGGVTVTYHSANTKVAKVDKEGRISAIGVGSTNIITKISLYNGTTKTFKTKVTVKKPTIVISGKNSMKIGSTFKFSAKTDGINSNDIIWSTTKKSILEINRKTGKAAKSKGIDYVVAKIGNVKVKMKVVVL